MKCPLCNENDLEIRTNKKGEKTLCCEEWKPMLADELDKNSWRTLEIVILESHSIINCGVR